MVVVDHILDTIARLKNKYGKGVLSVGLAVLLVLSTVNIAAFAEGTLEGELEAVDTPSEEVVAANIEALQQEVETASTSAEPITTELGEALISFDVPNGYVAYNNEPILSTTVKTPLTSDFTFEVHPDTGFEVDSVKAVKTSTQAEIGMTSPQENVYTLAASDVSSDVTIKVETKQVESTESEGGNAAIPVDAIEGLSSGEQAPPVAQEGTHVVTFISNGEEYTARIVNDGDLVEAPSNPNIPEGMSSFIGWYTAADGTGVEFEFSTTAISGDLTLYAQFSDKFLVSFKTADDISGSVYTTQLVARGEYASLPTNPTMEGLVFQYWYIQGMDEPTAFDFSDTPIYSNITLVPQFGDGYYVIFESNGGSDVTHQVVTAGNSASKPGDPERKGYEFSFWSADVNADPEDEATYGYDFESNVTDSLTLYAIWKSGKVGYTVNIYNENAGIKGDPGYTKSNYSFVTSLDISPTDPYAGIAGESLGSSFVDYMTNYINGGKYSQKDASIYDLLDYSEYGWTDATDEATGKAKVISGSGDTVINVYAKRISYPLTFNLEYALDGGIKRGPVEITLSNGTSYVGSATQKTYTCYLKLGEELEGKWPSGVTFTDEANKKYKFVNFNGWHGLSNKGTATSKSYIRVAYLGNSHATTHSRITALSSKLMTANCRVSSYKEVRYYYTEASDATIEKYGTDAFFDIGSQVKIAAEGPAKQLLDDPTEYKLVKFKDKYYEFNISSVGNYQTNWSPKGWPGKEIAGYETITKESKDKYNTYTYQVAINDNSTLFNTFNNGDEDGVKIGSICYFMPAKSFELVLNAGIGGTIENADGFTMKTDSNSGVVTYTKTIKYGEPLGIDGLEAKGKTDFSGWFRGDDFSGKLTEDEVSHSTMPASNLVLYAGFADEIRTLTYYNSVGEKQPVDTQTVAKGAKTEGSDFYTVGQGYEGLGQFIGWGYLIPGTNVLVEYNFDLAINSDQELYALWKTGNFKVTYNIGAGEGVTPVDGNSYGLGARANLLDNTGFTAPAGSVFIGWQPKGSNAIYYPGPATSVTMYGDLNLNAYYVSENTDIMYVLYDSNNDTGNTVGPFKTIGFSTMVAQGEDTFTHDGYKLVGWSTEAGENNSVDYALDAQFTVPNLAKDSTYTLYAVWEEIPSYTVKFVAEQGGSLDGTATYSIRANQPFKDVVTEWPNPIADAGYYFTGWDPASYNKMYVSEDLTFTAHFESVVNPTIVIGDGSKIYGNADPDLVSTEIVTVNDPNGARLVNYTPVVGDLTRAAGEDVDTYKITLTDQGLANIQAALSAAYGEKYVANTGVVTPGTFVINKRTVVITSDYETKEYDGEPLTGDSVTVSDEGFADGEGASYKYTASITLPGSTPNTFEYTLNENTKASNYEITTATDLLVVTRGSLVTDAQIVITVGNGEKIYDGQALTPDSNEIVTSGLPVGHTIEVAASGSLTDAGEAVATVENYVIKNKAGDDVTSLFADQAGAVTINEGKLTVFKRQITLTSATDSKLYDGTALTNDEVTVSGDGFASGEGASYNVTGSLVDPGTGSNTFEYVLTGGADARNYAITTVFGTLTVEPVDAPVVPGVTVPGGGEGEGGGTGNDGGGNDGEISVSPVVEIVAETLSAPIMMLEETMGITESMIDDNLTPFASRTGCWMHWYILLGIMLTAGYAASVVIRRRNFAAKLDDFEMDVLGVDGQAKGGTPGFKPAPQGA